MEEWKFEFTNKKLRGDVDEELFIKDVLAANPDVKIRIADTYEENSGKHIDVWVNNTSFDVKGIKSIGLLNLDACAYTILEWKDSYGELGWMHGEADYIAFKRPLNWIISPRKKLIQYYKDNVTNEWVTDLNDAHLKKYKRFNSEEEMTAVHFNNIVGFSKILNRITND